MKKRSSPQSAPADPAPGAPAEAAIGAMGAQGDGVALTGSAKVYIPFTLPGETVRAQIEGAKGKVIVIEQASPDRASPLCKHFGVCGGCSLQHWREEPYAEWKLGLVKTALAREGLGASVEGLKTYPAASRRRATFTARKDGGTLRLGFNAAQSHDLVDLEECPILLPQLGSALPPLKAALAGALPNRGGAKVCLTSAENGLDCIVEAPRLAPERQAQVTETLLSAGVVRATWNGETVFFKEAPFVLAGGVKVMLPQGAFLQAVEDCERDIADFAGEALAEAKVEKGPVCDLFAGLGAFTFPCAKRSSVAAYEENPAATAALEEASKGAHGLKPVHATRRDLFRNPLGPMELKAFSAAIADPPREGAEAQSRALAASQIRAVVMLSCNPVTFARDAAILVAGGFSLARLAAFDQFRFSPHVEIAAAFVRARSKKGRLVRPVGSPTPFATKASGTSGG